MSNLILKPNINCKYNRSEYADTKANNITILDVTDGNKEPMILLDKQVKNWAELLRQGISTLRPLIDETAQHYDFESLFNKAMEIVIRTNDFKFDKNFSQKLYIDDSFIKSSVYKNKKNHKIPIIKNVKGEQLYICAVFTCEVVCVLQALIDTISVSRNIKIMIDYTPKEPERILRNQTKKLKQLIKQSNNIVFFGGAGVSTESGIPDFRSKDGLYNQEYAYPPEEILSHTFFMNYPDEFYKFYKDKMNCLNYEPNITHIKLAQLEKKGKLKAIVTQNIDGLHQKAGSNNVFELHGSVLRNYCMKCHKSYSAEYVFNSDGIPRCFCGGIIKPDVVLYEESLNHQTLEDSRIAIQKADLLIVAGTSLTVQPASALVDFFQGKNLVLINRDITPLDLKANLRIRESLGQVFEKI